MGYSVKIDPGAFRKPDFRSLASNKYSLRQERLDFYLPKGMPLLDFAFIDISSVTNSEDKDIVT